MLKYRVTVESADPDFTTLVFELTSLKVNQNRDLLPVYNDLGQYVSLEPGPVYLHLSGQLDPKEAGEHDAEEVGAANGEG